MSYSIALTLHIIAATIWVGGMFFAHMILRPSSVEKLEPPLRLPLWNAVFGRFFFWVWISIITILITGYWIIIDIYGDILSLQITYIQLMHFVGLLMTAIFSYIFFVPYQAFKTAVEAGNFPAGGEQMNKIRQLVTINLVLGIITIIVASAGKFIFL
ncbi:MAG: CopD family protein [Thiotrichaceae bacterium]|nr:CopD family protein [Thiotrichaceae bacterium]